MDKLNLKKKSWDMGGQKAEDYFPGSNTGAGPAGYPHKTPKAPSDLPRGSRSEKEDYTTPSLLDRESEEHPASTDRGSGPDAQSGGGGQNQSGGDPSNIENTLQEPSNRLRRRREVVYRPFEDLEFNRNDSLYQQTQMGLNLKREVKGFEFDFDGVPKPPAENISDSKCAYCGYTYDVSTGERDYSKPPTSMVESQSEGICIDCRINQMNDLGISAMSNKKASLISPEGYQHVCNGTTHPEQCWIDENGIPGRPVSPEEEATQDLSHGMCQNCLAAQREELALYRANKGAGTLTLKKQADHPGDFNNAIIRTLTNLSTPEEILINYIDQLTAVDLDSLHEAPLANYIQMINLIKDHPNLTNPNARNTIEDLLIDFTVVKASKEQDWVDHPIDDSEMMAGAMEPEQEKEEWQKDHEEVIENSEIPPIESSGLTVDEMQFINTYSEDEIWEMAKNGDPIAQDLITRGIVASRKMRLKQALLNWTNIDHGIASNSRLARNILYMVRHNRSLEAAGSAILGTHSIRKLYSRLDGHTEHKVAPILKHQKKRRYSSVLDSVRGELDEAVWQDGPEGSPMLRPDVKVEIVERFFSYLHRYGGYIEPGAWVKNMFYTGSTASYRYNDTSDIDIHIVVDWNDMLKLNPDKKSEDPNLIWQELHDTFWWTLNKLKLDGTKHPIQYYVVKPGEEKKIVEQKEEIYDMGHDLWLIPPGSRSEVPEEVMEVAVETASDVMSRIDQHISDTRKGLIDYALLVECVNPGNAKDVYRDIARKVKEIDSNLKELKEEYSVLKQKRSDAFSDDTVNSNFSLNNVIFKLVERYKYLDVLRQIKRITDSMDLSPDQIPDIADAVGLLELFD